MRWIRRIADYLDPIERRDYDASMMNAFGPGVGMVNGYPGNPRLAENLSTITACVNAIASAMAQLLAFVHRGSGNTETIDDGHPVTRLIEQGPNQHQPWPNWIEWVMRSVLLTGNAIAEIVTDSRGAVVALVPIPWSQCNVQLLRNGRLAYDVTTEGGRTARPRRLLQDEIFHLKDTSDDGLVGVSRLRRAAAVLEAGLSIQTFANNIYKNGAFPSGALQTDMNLGAEGKARLTKNFEQGFTGANRAARVLLLDQGLKWQSISLSPEDSEFLANRRFTVEELCRIYNVPPTVVGDLSNSSFTNSETTIRWFAQATLAPWVKKVEAEFSRSVFSEATRRTHRLEIDMSGLLRGDPQQRWQSYDIAIKNGILSANEIRSIEGFGPLPTLEPSAG